MYIVVTGNQYREPPSAALRFPIAADLVNFTKGNREFSEVNVPPSLVQERMAEMDENGEFYCRPPRQNLMTVTDSEHALTHSQ